MSDETLGSYFSERKERGRLGLPLYSVTLENGLVPRDTLDRRTESALEDGEHALVEPGDIAYNMMRMWQGALGVSEKACLVSPAYVVMRPKENVDVAFAAAWMKSERGLNRLWAYSHGITDDRLRLYPDDFLTIPVRFPALAEQQRVAGVLSAWDEVINNARQSINLQRRRKRANQFQLFGDSHNPFMVRGRRLDAIATVEYGRGVRAESYVADGCAWVVGTSGVMGRTNAGDIGAAIVVGRKGTLDNPVYIPAGQAFAAIDTTFVIRSAQDTKSLFYYLDHVGLKKLNEASGVPSIGAETLRSLPIPTLNDKQSIILDCADDEIRTSEALVNLLLRQKRGLMQKLLTGEWRVPATGDSLAPGGTFADRLEAAE